MIKKASALIKSTDEFGRDQYLLLQSFKDFGEFTGFWFLPGDTTSESETSEQSLIKNLKRLINLDIKVIKKISEIANENEINEVWECTTDKNDDYFKLQENEIADAEYFTFDQMSVIYIWPEIKKFFEDVVFMKKIL